MPSRKWHIRSHKALSFHVRLPARHRWKRFTPIGPELRKMTAAPAATAPAPFSPERRRQLAEATVATQFEAIAAAAQGCDVIVAATALQIAARSVAEKMGVPYVFVAHCPAVLPSAHHALPPLPSLPGQAPVPATADNGTAHAPGAPTTDSLTFALERSLQPEVAARARSIATTVRRDGARVAAQHVTDAGRGAP